MKILQGDEWANQLSAVGFLNEMCPQENKAQVEQLIADKNWTALDELMAPFFNIEQ